MENLHSIMLFIVLHVNYPESTKQIVQFKFASELYNLSLQVDANLFVSYIHLESGIRMSFFRVSFRRDEYVIHNFPRLTTNHGIRSLRTISLYLSRT